MLLKLQNYKLPFGANLSRQLAKIALQALCLALFLFIYAPRAEAAQPRVVYGFDREFAPLSFQDPGGKAVGFEIELMEAIFKDQAVLSLRPLDWYNVPLELSSGAINVTSGMVKTPQRAKTFRFSDEATFNLAIRFFTKVYKRVPTPDFLRGQAVAVEEDSFQQSLLEQFGGINIKKYKNRALALRALYNDEVDAFCGPDEPAYYYLRKLNYGGITTVGSPLGITSLHIAVNRDRGDILRIVNKRMSLLITSGEYDRIYRKWFVVELKEKEIEDLSKAAKDASINAYAPYGKINYGAAILTATGKIYSGSIIENANPKLTISAIDSALAKAFSANDLEIRAAILLDHNGNILKPTEADCAVLFEFGRGILFLERDQGKLKTLMLAEYLKNKAPSSAFSVNPK